MLVDVQDSGNLGYAFAIEVKYLVKVPLMNNIMAHVHSSNIIYGGGHLHNIARNVIW